MLNEAIEHLPQAQQLAIAGRAIEQMAEVIRLRSTLLSSEWESVHIRIDPEAPTVEAIMIEAWVKQLMTVHWDAFIEPPRSARRRTVKVKLAPTDSIVGEVEPGEIVQTLDEMEREQSASTIVPPLPVDASDEEDFAEPNVLRAAMTVAERRNFAVKLGDGNPTSFTVNQNDVPDWGVLRFDLHTGSVPADAPDPTKPPQLELFLRPVGSNSSNNAPIVTIDLVKAKKGANEYENNLRRIGYGETGFETFTIDVPPTLRGQAVYIEFRLQNSGKPVCLDNVFFKSQHLLFGNPTEARATVSSVPNQYVNNYLLEKPQFTASYSENDNIPNWSAWQLNNDWTGSTERPPDNFFGDPVLALLGWRQVGNTDYRGNYPDGTPKANLPQLDSKGNPYKLAPGHLAPVSHRNRSEKDIWAIYLTTNIVPQFDKLNSPVWRDLETKFEKVLATRSDERRELYIYSGSVGTKQDKPVITITDRPDSPYDIRVPKALWRVVIIADEPGLQIHEITESNTTAFALIAANELPSPGQSPFDKWYQNFQISLL